MQFQKRHSKPRGNTIESIATDFPDETDFMRHFAFCRFILRERTLDAAYIARQAEGTIALTVPKMQHLAVHWHHDPECNECVFKGAE